MPETAASERIQLLIGEKTFNTTKATIAESRVLSTLVSLRPPEEGPYFVDADPTLFEHVLRYLRTSMFPLFYDPDKGHDICLYLALLNQARFYQIERLENWIATKGYQEAVSRRTWANSITLCGEDQIEHLEELTHLKNESLRILKVTQSQAKCFRCPNRNWKHDGRRQNCVRDGCITNYSSGVNEVSMRVLKIDYVVTSVDLKDEQALPMLEDPSVPPPYHAS